MGQRYSVAETRIGAAWFGIDRRLLRAIARYTVTNANIGAVDRSSPAQTLIVKLPAGLVRRVAAIVDEEGAYASISEYVAVALANQLALEDEGPQGLGVGASADAGRNPPAEATREDLFLHRPSLKPLVAEMPRIQHEPLSSLTNRLFPLRVALRVLASEGAGEGLDLPEFHSTVSRVARDLGIRLRHDDEARERRGWERRWIALPVGDDERAARQRYNAHFTLSVASDDRPAGPLSQLGLAFSEGRRGLVYLTGLGLELATAPSPVLDGADGEGVLGDVEREVFGRAIKTNPAELDSLREFREMVESAGGVQDRVDDALQQHHPDWTRAQAVSHRASIVGRLWDLGAVQVDGRGGGARIKLAPAVSAIFDGTSGRS